MKTKAKIVQRLLEEKKIDAEEAVILLMEGEKERDTVYVPYPQPYYPTPWVVPCNPSPVWISTPITSTTTLNWVPSTPTN